MNESETGIDLVWTETSLFSNVKNAVLMLISIGSDVSIKTRSAPDSFSFKGQATKHTIVKWSIKYYVY